MVNLAEIRKKIDAGDALLAHQLRMRMELALVAGRLKALEGRGILDSARERDVLERAGRIAGGALKQAAAERFFSAMMREARELQGENPRLVGYQGMPGAYGEWAAGVRERSAIPISCSSFREVLEGVWQGIFDFGAVPIENSIGGAVVDANLLLANTTLSVGGEVILPIHHCLLALPETDFENIKIVLSHPQALAQCSNAISENGWKAVEHNDTAGASLKVAFELLQETAAISRDVCTRLYGLEILQRNLENDPTNRTRFLVFEARKPEMHGSRHIVSLELPGMQELAGFVGGILEAGGELVRVFSVQHAANLLSALKGDVQERLGELLQGKTGHDVKGGRQSYRFVVEFDREGGIGKIAGQQGLVHIGSYEPAEIVKR